MGRANRDIDAWMARLADGDREAFDPLYAALWPLVQRFCDRRLAGDPRAEDAAQNALVRVFERASSYDVSRPALPWVLTLAAWECRTVAGRTVRAREEALSEEDHRTAENPEEALLRIDLALSVREVLGSLEPSDEASLWEWMLRDLADGPTGPTLRKRMERARRRFAQIWRRSHGAT